MKLVTNLINFLETHEITKSSQWFKGISGDFVAKWFLRAPPSIVKRDLTDLSQVWRTEPNRREIKETATDMGKKKVQNVLVLMFL